MNIAGNLPFADDRSGRNFGRNNGFFAYQQNAIGVDFALERASDSHGPVVGDGALEHNALPYESADILSGFVAHRFRAQSIALSINVVGASTVLFLLPHNTLSSS